MGATATCSKCGKTDHYDNVLNRGTAWRSAFAVVCSACGTTIPLRTLDPGPGKMLDASLRNVSKAKVGKEGGLALDHLKRDNRDRRQRAASGDVREYWITQYVKQMHKLLDLNSIKGPFDVGPDFKATVRGKELSVEVEVDCKRYIAHGHHKDPKYSEVQLLIALVPERPTGSQRKLLPPQIKFLDVDDFVQWWDRKARQYALRKKKDRPYVKARAILIMIAEEFERRHLRDQLVACPRREHQMATCPDCANCPYYDEAPSFELLAIRFVSSYRYPILSDGFTLSKIRPSAIDNFYRQTVRASRKKGGS